MPAILPQNVRVVEGDDDLTLLGALQGIRAMGFQAAVVFVLRSWATWKSLLPVSDRGGRHGLPEVD